MNRRPDYQVWQFGPLAILVLVWLVKEILRVVGTRTAEWWRLFRIEVVTGSMLLIGGWVLGYILVDLDKYLPRLKLNAGNVEGAVGQWSAAIRNVLTVAALVIVGVWVVTSTISPLAWGLVMSMQLKLFAELLNAVDWKKWYWVFAREFSESEHRLFIAVWAVALAAQFLILLRR